VEQKKAMFSHRFLAQTIRAFGSDAFNAFPHFPLPFGQSGRFTTLTLFSPSAVEA
jgi:hypothetical protein